MWLDFGRCFKSVIPPGILTIVEGSFSCSWGAEAKESLVVVVEVFVKLVVAKDVPVVCRLVSTLSSSAATGAIICETSRSSGTAMECSRKSESSNCVLAFEFVLEGADLFRGTAWYSESRFE